MSRDQKNANAWTIRPKPRTVLLTLLIAGVLLEIAAIYGAHHPIGPAWKVAITLNIVFLIVVPIVVWKTHGEALLRTALMSTWVIYLVSWSVGFYRMYRD